MKKILSATILSLALASTAFAAVPDSNLASGQISLGYSYENLQTDMNGLGNLGAFKGNAYQAAYGLTDKVSLTGEYLRSNSRDFNVYSNGVYSSSLTGLHFNSTALGVQYQLTKQLALAAGSFKSEIASNYGSAATNEVFGGIAYEQPITAQLTSYASYKKSENIGDLKAGIVYAMDSQTSLEAGYHDYQNKVAGHVNTKGISFGVNHKF
ncbi:MAG: hypothetical protein E6713_08590 [Sporomusaceae bacterium]|nr:hypothetical protein [Sporomusaceae bacterium]